LAAKATRSIRIDGFVDPCLPTLAAKPPSGPGWVHEIKHDGYRLIVRERKARPARGSRRCPQYCAQRVSQTGRNTVPA
jgi:ATP-dependent DNA ligase